MSPYLQHSGRVIEDSRFSHLMALTLDPGSDYKNGLIRCITSREGNVAVKGFIDRSKLHVTHGESLEHFTVSEELIFANTEEILGQLISDGDDFIGFEDPDIFLDIDGTTHVYFTIPIRPEPLDAEEYRKIRIHLGHAEGKDLTSLTMTMPVLQDIGSRSAKEVSIAPLNSRGVRLNLVESRDRSGETTFSIVQVAIAHSMSGPWEYGDIAFHPAKAGLPWIAGHASPGPLLPSSFLDVGNGKALGVINGREANRKEGDKIQYGIFSVGLFIYDFEKGVIDWVSPERLIRDSEAQTITFASQFVETQKGEGILYAHVDDSFVRAYTLYADKLRRLLP